jgi:hypothetical protein
VELDEVDFLVDADVVVVEVVEVDLLVEVVDDVDCVDEVVLDVVLVVEVVVVVVSCEDVVEVVVDAPVTCTTMGCIWLPWAYRVRVYMPADRLAGIDIL